MPALKCSRSDSRFTRAPNVVTRVALLAGDDGNEDRANLLLVDGRDARLARVRLVAQCHLERQRAFSRHRSRRRGCRCSRSGRSASLKVGSSFAGTVMRVFGRYRRIEHRAHLEHGPATRQESGRPENHGQASGQPVAIVARLIVAAAQRDLGAVFGLHRHGHDLATRRRGRPCRCPLSLEMRITIGVPAAMTTWPSTMTSFQTWLSTGYPTRNFLAFDVMRSSSSPNTTVP